MPKRKLPTIFVVSDGRGETATQLVTAAALQFEQRYRIVRESEVRTPERVEKIVKRAAAANAVIFYTLVEDDTRAEMRRAGNEMLVPSVDILGPAFTALGDLFHTTRGSTPGLFYSLEHERFDRMEAIDYTLTHDDGQRPHELNQADLVVVGVSRASKSSTCFFLAYNGVKAANVPLLPDIPPPEQLLKLPPEKVIGLRVTVDRLITVREARAAHLGFQSADPYLDRKTVAREVIAAHRMMEKHGWRWVEASYLAVEEIAREVMQLARS
jgi:regulator of PEP synthase PpsR (kinase-PPPase family)